MTDANEDPDLLEDGDMSEVNFELDLAEEDALLADDDDKPVIGGSRINDVEASQEDDDYLELGMDDDLSFDEIIENGSSTTRKHTPIAIAFNDEDSDEKAKCGSERDRFKSERQVIARSSTAIPETLDAVTVRLPVRTSRGGGVRGKLMRGGSGGMMRGGVRPSYRGGGNFRFHPPSQGQHTIHVNPHFRPRQPHPPPPTHPGGGQMWNGGYQGPPHPPYNVHPQPPPYSTHPQPPYLGPGFQPPVQNQGVQWQDPGYYHPPGGPPLYGQQPPIENNYYGGPPQNQYYSPQQNFGPQVPPPHSQMGGWGGGGGDGGVNYPAAPPHNQSFPGPPNFGPHPPGPPQMMAPRMRPPGPPRPPFVRPPQQFPQQKPFQQQHKQQQFQGGKQWNRGGKREHMPTNLVRLAAPPMKQARTTETPSSAFRVLSNLEKVQTVDKIPTAVQQQQQKASLPPPPEEEDEEMKAYRKKIEEQKKLREKILKQKEQKRMVAAQQKHQVSQGLKVSVIQTLAVSNAPPPQQAPPKTEPTAMKMVRIKTTDGKTIIKKMSVANIQKLKKSTPPMGRPPPSLSKAANVESRIVSVENLSASTTQTQLVNMASQLGPVEKVELDGERKKAIIKFARNDSAHLFVQKYQLKMLDLSMIRVKLVRQE